MIHVINIYIVILFWRNPFIPSINLDEVFTFNHIAKLFFEMKCLRAILRVTRSDRLSNIAIRKSLNVVETIEEVGNCEKTTSLVRSCSEKPRYD